MCASLSYVYYTPVIRVCAARCRRLLYLCHMCVCSTMSTGAIYISHVLTRLHMSHVSYTSIYESWLSPETLLPNRDMCMCNKVNTCVGALSAISTIPLSYVCVQHVVDRCVCRVERYVYVQQSKHMPVCVCISLLCLLYLCHMCVCSTSSTGACVV